MYVTAKNIKRAGLDLSNITYVDKDVHREIYARCNPEKGDIYKITARFDACDDEKIFGMVAVRYCRYSIGFYSCVCKR